MATAQERTSMITKTPEVRSEFERRIEPRHRMLLDLSPEMQERMQDLIRRTGYDEGELFNLAIACFMMGLDANEDGKRVGIVDDDREMFLEFSGFHKDDPTVK